jgi:hypothetical protein
MLTDYSLFDNDDDIQDLCSDFANATIADARPWYEGEDCFEVKARERELAEA